MEVYIVSSTVANSKECEIYSRVFKSSESAMNKFEDIIKEIDPDVTQYQIEEALDDGYFQMDIHYVQHTSEELMD